MKTPKPLLALRMVFPLAASLIVLLLGEGIARGSLSADVFASFIFPHIGAYLLAWLLLFLVWLLLDWVFRCPPLSTLGMAVLGCAPCAVNFYTMQLRGEPFLPWDLTQVSEAAGVASAAGLKIQPSMVVTIIVVLALGMESQLRLRREEEARLSLEREKMQSDRLLQSMSRIVDRYTIVNLDTDRYRYRELRLSKPLYPTSGQYSEMLKIISERYVALTETENAKLSRLLAPDYLRSVLRKPNDNLKIEYCSRTENAYLVLTIIPVAWHADGTVYEVMQIVQDIGQKVELETMANTDSLTGLFNERYFSRVMNICEEKKLPFVLYYLDLDRFKPVNDTYGHAIGDRLLQEIAARLLRCIRSRDYAFRIGGDEFALIVSADMDEGQRARMTERIQTTLSAPVVIDGKELSVGVSCGCACYPEDGGASQVRITADSRMYETKQRHHENDRTEEEA